MASNTKDKEIADSVSTTTLPSANNSATSHVHFDQTVIKDDFESDNSIAYHKSSKNNIVVHLGFLQVNHRYKIELKIPTNILEINTTDANNEETTLLADDEDVPNINCRMLQYHGKCESTSTYGVDVEFYAHKEKLLKEELKLTSTTDPNEKYKLLFQARVLGRGKGTPMLRNGIHCIGIGGSDADDESDASDWHGFSRNDSD